jgi:serine/threonine protein kinase
MTCAGFTTLSIGTVPYLAPELFVVLDAEKINVSLPRTTKYSDVYSFALLVLEARFWSFPFELAETNCHRF